MTTAHKPTFHPAIGSANQGGYRYAAPRQQYSSRDLPGQLTMKLRQSGQNTQEEVSKRDLKSELQIKENTYKKKLELEKQRQGMLSEPALSVTNSNDEQQPLAIEYFSKELASFDDADDKLESDKEDNNNNNNNNNHNNNHKKDNENDDDSDIQSEDEEALLYRELEAIRKENAIQRAKQEAEERKKKN